MKVNDYNFEINDKVSELLANYDEEKYAPKKSEIFRALELTKLSEVKVVILGQDPYPTKGDACGLSFSVNREDKLPKSLINMYKELQSDLGITATSGDLSTWAKSGVLLLNTVLTVEISKANSHHDYGWQETTNQIIKQVAQKGDVVFVLLGKQAQKYEELVKDNNMIIKQAHPSPLSAYRGFFGSKIFSEINKCLESVNKAPINWQV